MPFMPSKFRSTCKGCGNQIRIGESIYWEKEIGSYHQLCWEARTPPPVTDDEQRAAESLADRLHFIGPGEPIPAEWNVR